MKITYIHHSAFLVETESAYLLFDYFQGKLPEFLRKSRSMCLPVTDIRIIFKGDLELEEKHPKIHYILALISGVSGFRNLVKKRQNF